MEEKTKWGKVVLTAFSHIYGLLYEGKIPEDRAWVEKCEEWISQNKETFQFLESLRGDLFMSDRELNALALALDL